MKSSEYSQRRITKNQIYQERVSNVALINPKGQILMELRNGGSYRSLFGGKVDDGETPRAAAIREVEEETSYQIEQICFLGRKVLSYVGRHGPTEKIRSLYIAPLYTPPKKLVFRGCEGGEYFNPNKITSLPVKKPLDDEVAMIQRFVDKIHNTTFDRKLLKSGELTSRQKFILLMQDFLK